LIFHASFVKILLKGGVLCLITYLQTAYYWIFNNLSFSLLITFALMTPLLAIILLLKLLLQKLKGKSYKLKIHPKYHNHIKVLANRENISKKNVLENLINSKLEKSSYYLWRDNK